jgi:UDP-N-acetylmuramyl pentapeptide synthase
MAAGFAGETHAVNDASAAAELLSSLLRPRDTVLVKGSRGIGLELVADALRADPQQAARGEPVAGPRAR